MTKKQRRKKKGEEVRPEDVELKEYMDEEKRGMKYNDASKEDRKDNS
jgi:hypothetical protein